VDGDPHTVDSPLQALGMYLKVMGPLKTIGGLFDDNYEVQDQEALEVAFRAFGAAFDKGGDINLDVIAYTNAMLGLTETDDSSWMPTECIDIRQEVRGTMKLVEHCFLDYAAAEFTYNRGTNFASLPDPPYLSAEGSYLLGSTDMCYLDPVDDSETACTDGMFEVLDTLTVPNIPGLPSFQVVHEMIYETVFDPGDDVGIGEAALFAQASNDTRAVINHMHLWAVPGISATDPPCTELFQVTGIVISGFEVPTKIVAGSPEKVISLTVSNTGSDETSVGLLITATVEDDGSDENIFYFGLDENRELVMLDDEPTIEESETFNLGVENILKLTGSIPSGVTDGESGHVIHWVATIKVDSDLATATGVSDIMSGGKKGKPSGARGGGKRMLRRV